MKAALASYLAEVERGLSGLPAGRRRLFLRELEGHLLDEAEARGIEDEGAMEDLLSAKESPREIAFELSSSDDGDAVHRNEIALLAGALLGLATGGYLWLQGGWPWHLSLAFGTAHGLAVGSGILLVRSRWQSLGPRARVLASIVFGTLMAIPLGFTSTRGFVASRLLYGGFTGYLLERHSLKARAPWQPVLETLAFTAVDFVLEVLVVQRVHHYNWSLEMSFNFTLALGVLLAIHCRRLLVGRWLLNPMGR
jgi:hypothetical protein